ncbi:Putative Sas10/Utp3/C1D family protein [[Torrubiella] hemipterigena]|uniref:Exosome complex protein n=1 Tax=[Torrubiella] hemipterigena TaxID=1531966 RepID=A0A0A1T2B3_9HYPO|nr:Putative Sas10/Utp3/C1D family protein [[Torrubiella] hemipterigena]
MSGVKDIVPDLERLDSQLDSLEDALQPLFDGLDDMSQLPLLDKAKLYSLTAYAIESLLFSALKLEGADAQNHAVYAELKRVQQYFGKIKAAEEPAGQRTTSVNQEAAARVLKADLSDNKLLSSRLAEKIAEEKAKALLRTFDSKKRSGDDTPSGSADEQGNKKQKQKHRGKSKSKK